MPWNEHSVYTIWLCYIHVSSLSYVINPQLTALTFSLYIGHIKVTAITQIKMSNAKHVHSKTPELIISSTKEYATRF